MRKAWPGLIPWPFLMLGLSGLCHAEQSCPWLSPATAAAFLSTGSVKTVVSADACRFTGSVAELTIEMKTDSCGKDATPLRGIGNEAVACTVDKTEKVVSRVRGAHFVVVITSADKSIRERVPRIAEQVAGSLF